MSGAMSASEVARVSGVQADFAGATRVRWTQVAPTLLIVWIVSMFDKANMSIVQNSQDFLSEIGLNGQQAKIGLLSTGLLLAYGLGAPLWGWLVGRIGARKTAALSLVIWGLTSVWSGLAAGYGSLLWSRIILGGGEAALYPCTLALVANWFALKERGRATAFWWIGTMIGPMIMGVVVTFLIVQLGWRGQFYAIGVLAVILPLPMMWFLVRERPAEHPSVNAAEAGLVEAGSLEHNEEAPGRIAREGRRWFSNIRFWLAATAIAANNIMYWGWSIWLPTYLRTERGFSFSVSGYLTFVIFGCAVATILLFGHLSDRIFRRAPLAGAGWLFGAVLLMGSALAPTPAWSVVLATCALCSQQVGISCGEMLMHSVVVGKEMGASQGTRALIQSLLGALSPFIIGLIVQLSGSFIGAFAMLSLAIVISASCMIKLALDGY